MKTAGLALISLGMSLAAPAFASAESLTDALTAAYGGNPALQAARAKLRAQDEEVPQALSNWRPSVTLSGAVGDSVMRGNYVPNLGEHNMQQTYTAALSQPVYRGGQTEDQTAQAKADVQAGRAQLHNTEQTVLLNVVTAYEDVLQGQALVALNRNNEQVMTRDLEATDDRFKVGEVTRTDVAQSQSRLSGAHADLVRAEGDLKAATANYLALVGHLPGTLTDPAPLNTLPGSVAEARDLAMHDNPQVVAQGYAAEAARHAVDLATDKLKPRGSLDASETNMMGGPEAYILQPPSSNFVVANEKSRVSTATLTLTVPIYQQGVEYSDIRQQKNLAGEARTQLDEMRRDAVDSATRAWENLQAARARITSYSAQIKAAQVALEGVRKENEVGSRTVLDVLNAEQELLASQVNLVAARHDSVVAEFALKSAVGQLTARSLGLPVEIYDPIKHYDDVRGKWFGTSASPDDGDGGK